MEEVKRTAKSSLPLIIMSMMSSREKLVNKCAGTNRIGEQRRLRRVCAYVQFRKRLRCSHTKSIDVFNNSDQNLHLSSACQHSLLKETLAYMR